MLSRIATFLRQPAVRRGPVPATSGKHTVALDGSVYLYFPPGIYDIRVSADTGERVMLYVQNGANRLRYVSPRSDDAPQSCALSCQVDVKAGDRLFVQVENPAMAGECVFTATEIAPPSS